MADRTSVRLFGAIFEILARHPDACARDLACHFWKLTREYDCADYQMGCDDALRKLDLLRDGPPGSRYPECGRTLVYGLGEAAGSS